MSADLILFPARKAWIPAFCLLAIDAIFLPIAGFDVESSGLLTAVSAFATMILIHVVYTRWRPEPMISAASSAAAFLIAFTSIAALFSFLTLRLAAPLQDDFYARADSALGFDWAAHIRWLSDHPTILYALNLSYFSCLVQIAVIVIGLATLAPCALSRFLLLFAATASVVCILGALAPAAGAYAVHPLDQQTLGSLPDPLTGRWHMEQFLAARSGALKSLNLIKLEGVIQFPSFHAALAVILTHSLRCIPWLGFPALLLNGAMLISTIAIGGHYLVDVIAGVLIAIIAIAATRPNLSAMTDSPPSARRKLDPRAAHR